MKTTTTTTTTAYAMTLLETVMKNGKTDRETADKVLREHHACTVTTLARAGLVWAGLGVVKTPERHAADLQKMERKEKRAVLLKQMAELQKQLDALKG